jgi:hypothetical protein
MKKYRTEVRQLAGHLKETSAVVGAVAVIVAATGVGIPEAAGVGACAGVIYLSGEGLESFVDLVEWYEGLP